MPQLDPNAWALIKPLVDRLCPDFDQQTFLDMEQAYQADVEFAGTPYADKPDMIKAFYVYWEVLILTRGG